MIRKAALAVSCLMLFVTTGCAHRVVYTERYEPEPVVVRRTVVVDRRPHYYHPRPYATRVVVVNRRPPYRGDYHHYDSHRDGGGVHIHAEASAR